jgi:hypothetical protein
MILKLLFFILGKRQIKDPYNTMALLYEDSTKSRILQTELLTLAPLVPVRHVLLANIYAVQKSRPAAARDKIFEQNDRCAHPLQGQML